MTAASLAFALAESSSAANAARSTRWNSRSRSRSTRCSLMRTLEPQHVADDGLRVVAEQRDVAGVAGDGACRELVAGGVGDDSRVGLVADAQAVLGEQRGGVGVVGGDRRLLRLVLDVARRAGSRRPDDARVAQGRADAGRQLAGGLGREGQPEHLVGSHLPGGDQVDDAGGHHRGLARARTGHHDGRLERRGDGGELLLARWELGAHQPLQRGRGADLEGHDSTVPAPLTGQIGWNEQRWQWSPARASNSSERTAATASISWDSIAV